MPDALSAIFPAVQVVVVAYNSGDHLQRCVDALGRQTFDDFEATVWDNGSADDAVKALRTGPRVRKVVQPENLGFAAGVNRAAALSRSRYIALLNPDAFAEPDWLERLVAAAEQYSAEAVASLQLDDANPDILDGAGDCLSIAGVPWRGGYGQPRSVAPTEPCEVFSACGAAALYRRDVFEALGGFEERFFCYCEDVDLGFRLRRAGGRCVLEPRAVVRHVGGASGGGKELDFARYHGTRNRIWMALRDMPPPMLPIMLPANFLVTLYALACHPKLRRTWLSALRAALASPNMWRAPAPAKSRSTIAIARALSWSPRALWTRRPVFRALR